MYIIYRKSDTGGQSYFYGWSPHKSVVKAFFEQRSRDKYDVFEVTTDNPQDLNFMDPGNGMITDETQIDMVEIPIKATGEKTKLMITENELLEAEKRIQRYFRDKRSIINYPGATINTLKTYMLIEEYYMSALLFIGFYPPELHDVFDSAVYQDISYSDGDDIDYLIETAHLKGVHPSEDDHIPLKLMGGDWDKLDDLHEKMIYSLESFIKVLKDDM